jgi:hypothetical protein
MKPAREIIPQIEAIARRPWRGETVADQRIELAEFEARIKASGSLTGEVAVVLADAWRRIGGRT